MHDTIILEKIGLTAKQVAVYKAALETGEASMSELSEHAQLKRPTTYLAVDELLSLGLLSEIKKGKRKIYSPVHPRRLTELTKFRARQIEELLPELIAIYNTPKSKPKIQVFEGEEGVRQVYAELYESLSNKKEALWFTRIDALKKYMPFGATEFKVMLRKLSNPHIRELNFGDDAGKAWGKETKLLRGKNHSVRILPTTHPFGATDTLVYENKLVLFSLHKDLFVTVIENSDIVTSYRALFEWAWTQGKEV